MRVVAGLPNLNGSELKRRWRPRHGALPRRGCGPPAIPIGAEECRSHDAALTHPGDHEGTLRYGSAQGAHRSPADGEVLGRISRIAILPLARQR